MATNIPLVNVAAHLVDQQGLPVSGATIRMKLSCVEKYQGLVVPREVSKVTDANGDACLQVFPNELGTEGSEYDVHITGSSIVGPTDSCRCGNVGVSTMRTLRFSVVVPNSNCNLFDIANLPPYEQRGMGETLPSEVAGYSYSAAESATEAKNYADAARQVSDTVSLKLTSIEASKADAVAAAEKAETAALQAKGYSDGMKDVSRDFETTVIERTDGAVRTAIADAAACVSSRQEAAVQAVDKHRDDALSEISSLVGNARKTAIDEINNKTSISLTEIDIAHTQAKEDLRELASQYDEDFSVLVGRAEANAKKSACSAAAAASSADKACECKARAEAAAQGLERAKEDACLCATQAEEALECTKSIKNIVSDTADIVKNQTEQTREYKELAKQYAEQANTSQDAAQNSAEHAENSAKYAETQANIVLDNIDTIQKNTEDLQQLESDINNTRDFITSVNTETHAIAADVKEDRRVTGLARNAAQEAEANAKASEDAAKESARIAEDFKETAYKEAVKAKQAEAHIEEILATVEADTTAVEEAKTYVQSVEADVEQAIVDKSLELLTEELKVDVKTEADRAKTEADKAQELADQVKDSVETKLALAKMGKEFAILSDRVFKLENGASGETDGSKESGGNGETTDPTTGIDPETDDKDNPDSDEYFADQFSNAFKNG